MSRSYKATGINLKGIPFGETDRLLTILTIEQGLIRVIAPGARKHKSRLAGRSSQFVVNELLIVQGKRLDKLVQAETVRSFPGLTSDLARLTASQYLAELVLCQALSGASQGDLFALLVEHLQRLEQTSGEATLACLSQGIFHLLAAAGVAPEVWQCSLSQMDVVPDFSLADWRAGFSPASGGVISLAQLGLAPSTGAGTARIPSEGYSINRPYRRIGEPRRSPGQPDVTLITAIELALLQRLGQPELMTSQPTIGLTSGSDKTLLLWQRVERLLRHYAQYHFDRPIRSATLLDACFSVAVPAD